MILKCDSKVTKRKSQNRPFRYRMATQSKIRPYLTKCSQNYFVVVRLEIPANNFWAGQFYRFENNLRGLPLAGCTHLRWALPLPWLVRTSPPLAAIQRKHETCSTQRDQHIWQLRRVERWIKIRIWRENETELTSTQKWHSIDRLQNIFLSFFTEKDDKLQSESSRNWNKTRNIFFHDQSSFETCAIVTFTLTDRINFSMSRDTFAFVKWFLQTHLLSCTYQDKSLVSPTPFRRNWFYHIRMCRPAPRNNCILHLFKWFWLAQLPCAPP